MTKYFDKITLGFYETNKENRIEIADNEWKDLLNGEAQGKIICVENNKVILKDKVYSLEELKNSKLTEISSAKQAFIEKGFSYTYNDIEYTFYLDNTCLTNIGAEAFLIDKELDTDYTFFDKTRTQCNFETKENFIEFCKSLIKEKNRIDKLSNYFKSIVTNAEDEESIDALEIEFKEG